MDDGAPPFRTQHVQVSKADQQGCVEQQCSTRCMRPWLFNMQRLGLCCAALSMVVYTLFLPLRSHRIEL